MRVEPLQTEHVLRLQVQADQAHAFAHALERPDYFRQIAEAGPSFAAVEADRVLALAGLSDMGGGRAMAWCFLASDLRREMVRLVRTIRRYLDGCEYGRVELVTVPGMYRVEDFARVLGFEFEAPMLGWLPPATPGGRRGHALMWRRVRD